MNGHKDATTDDHAEMHALGASRVGVWLIAQVGAPVQRWLYRLTDGRLPVFGADRLLLLTVPGYRSGIPRTTPLFYVRDGRQLVVCNVRPHHERPNPWVRNLRHAGRATVRIGRDTIACRAREATDAEVARSWPLLTAIWPAYERHFAETGERTLFVLEPARNE